MHKVSWLASLLMMSLMVTGVFADEHDFLSESRKVVKQFGGELKQELLAALNEGGPVTALSVCSQKAPVIAEELAAGKSWTIARTSLSVRSPRNAPDTWQQKTLESFAERKASGEDPGKMEHYEVVTVEGKDVFRYMKAIPVVEPCLTCHGQQLTHDLKSRLNELYPEDQAIGFSVGDIIGAFSVSMSMSSGLGSPQGQ